MKLPEPLRLYFLGIALRVIASRPPDLVINDGYVERWHMIPKTNRLSKLFNIYIHRFNGDDTDDALHDHGPDNVSLLVRGDYDEFFHRKPLAVEFAYDGSEPPKRKYATRRVGRTQGDVIFRFAGTAHRIAMVGGEPPITLFVQGVRRRKWGFWCVNGWKPWEQYIDKGSYGNRAGKGCG